MLVLRFLNGVHWLLQKITASKPTTSDCITGSALLHLYVNVCIKGSGDLSIEPIQLAIFIEIHKVHNTKI